MKDIEEFLLETYGPRLTTADLAKVLKKTEQTIRKDICNEKFPIHTYKVKPGRRAPRYADYREVAKHLNASAGLTSPDQDAYSERASASPSSR